MENELIESAKAVELSVDAPRLASEGAPFEMEEGVLHRFVRWDPPTFRTAGIPTNTHSGLKDRSEAIESFASADGSQDIVGVVGEYECRGEERIMLHAFFVDADVGAFQFYPSGNPVLLRH